MRIETIYDALRTFPDQIQEARASLYHGRAFAVHRGEHIERFYKTKRGAEGYIKRQQRISWYDDYTQSMTTGGSGLEITEIQAYQLPDVSTDKGVWYRFMRYHMGAPYMFGNIEALADRYITDKSLREYVRETLADLKETGGMYSIDEYEISTAEESENKAEETASEAAVAVSAFMALNEDKNGIELRFDDKPSEAMRAQLKAKGFRWSRRQKLWYAKQSAERIAFAESLADKQSEETAKEKSVESFPEINILDFSNVQISDELAKAEHASNWIFRKNERSGADHAAELKEIYKHYAEDILKLARIYDGIDNEKAKSTIYYLKRDFKRYTRKYTENYIKRLRNRADNPSWAVTGRAGRNLARMEKAQSRYDTLMQESIELEANIKRKIKSASNKLRLIQEAEAKRKMQADIKAGKVSEIEFKTVKRKVDIYGNGRLFEKRAYISDRFAICKYAGMFRIHFDRPTSKTLGAELKTPLKTSSTLKEAKEYVKYLEYVTKLNEHDLMKGGDSNAV